MVCNSFFYFHQWIVLIILIPLLFDHTSLSASAGWDQSLSDQALLFVSVLLHKPRRNPSVPPWSSLPRCAATDPSPPTEQHRITDLLHHTLFWKQNQLDAGHTVTQLKYLKMAHNAEAWVKEDIWASVVYLSRDVSHSEDSQQLEKAKLLKISWKNSNCNITALE